MAEDTTLEELCLHCCFYVAEDPKRQIYRKDGDGCVHKGAITSQGIIFGLRRIVIKPGTKVVEVARS